jgi:hypothetical protein
MKLINLINRQPEALLVLTNTNAWTVGAEDKNMVNIHLCAGVHSKVQKNEISIINKEKALAARMRKGHKLHSRTFLLARH